LGRFETAPIFVLQRVGNLKWLDTTFSNAWTQSIKSTALSSILMMVVALVLARGISGITEGSITFVPSTPSTG